MQFYLEDFSSSEFSSSSAQVVVAFFNVWHPFYSLTLFHLLPLLLSGSSIRGAPEHSHPRDLSVAQKLRAIGMPQPPALGPPPLAMYQYPSVAPCLSVSTF
eukprot:RCo004388